jgi:hypothetical protein
MCWTSQTYGPLIKSPAKLKTTRKNPKKIASKRAIVMPMDSCCYVLIRDSWHQGGTNIHVVVARRAMEAPPKIVDRRSRIV